MKLLLIEDDIDVSDYILKGMLAAGHSLDQVFKGNEGYQKALLGFYDVMIVDRMLPEMDGLSIIKSIRGKENSTPALILSALGDIDDRVTGLTSGGDDYLVKPFSFAELLARVEILGRRNNNYKQKDIVKLYAANLELDLITRKVARGDKEIQLQSREFQLLEYMLKNKGQVITRTMLLEHVWNYHFDPQTNVIDVHISRLRSKVDKGHEDQIIRTVRGAGYIIKD